MLCTMKTASASHPAPADYRRIERAIAYLDSNFREQPALEDVARAAGLAPHHFARVFRRWAGISPKQLLQRLTLQSARDSLARDQSVLAAAYEAGLSGPGRLHDLFVTVEAVTPGEFKSRGRGMTIRHGAAATPFGTARLALTPRGIGFLGFEDGRGHVPGWAEYREAWRDAAFVEDGAAAAATAAKIWGAVGATHEPLRLWVLGTNFQVQVWQALLRAAASEAVSYADLARAVGRPAAARAVGGAVGANPVAWLIPCHHVLRSTGALGGYRWGIERKRAMLAWEVSRAAQAS
jgi:AraC family transcriptional regulator of adaptative response/methylated-DNA-[protein]-cysteine methyltransferase